MLRKRRNIKCFKICILILILVLLITCAYKTVSKLLTIALERLNEDVKVQFSDSEPKDILFPDIRGEIGVGVLNAELYSPYAILVRLKGHKIVFEKNSEEKIYPASLTKIMTVLVAIENIADLNKSFILPKSIFPDLYAANASMAGFLPGEEVSAADLLYGALLPSGAEASVGLALQVSGSEDEFVSLMNKKAKELKMDSTNFTNVTGLHDNEHYTTAKDISVLLEYALENKTFREIFTSERYFIAGTNLHPDGITFHSTLSEKSDTCDFNGGRILGGKTGYTDEAGLCLASLAEKNGEEYIFITAGAEGNPYTEQYNIVDALAMYNKYLER